jgi:hypothetical protein
MLGQRLISTELDIGFRVRGEGWFAALGDFAVTKPGVCLARIALVAVIPLADGFVNGRGVGVEVPLHRLEK